MNQKNLTALKGAGFVESIVKDEEGEVYKKIRRRSGKQNFQQNWCNGELDKCLSPGGRRGIYSLIIRITFYLLH